MHNVKRAHTTQQAQEARKCKESSQVQEYIPLENKVLSKKDANELTDDAFQLTTHILLTNPDDDLRNPEFYTAWNYRRDILLKHAFVDLTPERVFEILSKELQMTLAALKQHPKVYWIWNHRRWCLARIPIGPGDTYEWMESVWNRELYIVEKMLDLDTRNFHAWNYRRYVVASKRSPPSPLSELKYTMRKIESSVSNFSAWHHRSKLLELLWREEAASRSDVARQKDEEFELVRNALYTDPDDQSGWIYHRWLIGSGQDAGVLEREVASIEELLGLEPNNKHCLDALVHYYTLASRTQQNAGNTEERLASSLEMLQRLKLLDPFRIHRYEHISELMTRTSPT